MQITIKKEKNGTVVYSVTSTKEESESAKKHALHRFAPYVNVSGFRQGKAPSHLIEKNIKEEKLIEETLSMLASMAYDQALKDHPVEPIAKPNVTIPELEKEKDTEKALPKLWKKLFTDGLSFTITTYTYPEVTLGDYEKLVKGIKVEPTIETAKNLKEAAQKGDKKKETSSEEKPVEKSPHELDKELEEKILETLIEKITFDIPKELITAEAYQQVARQAQLVEQLGLSFEDYLKSQNKKIEELEKEATHEAETNLRTRFVLMQIAKEHEDMFTEKSTFRDILDYLKKIAKGEKPQKRS